MHTLTKNNKVIFKSKNKIDAIYEHQNYHRSQRVLYKYVTKVQTMAKYMVELEIDDEYTKLELALELALALGSIDSYMFESDILDTMTILEVHESNE